MNKNNKKSLILSIVTVLVLGIIITTSTFAYLQWSGGQTKVNVTIEMGGIEMIVEPEATEFVGLYPVFDCNNKMAYGDALVTIKNNTGTLAIPSFKLSVAIEPSTVGTGQLSYYREHVHYAVVALETTKDGRGNPVKGNPVGGNTLDNFGTGKCSAPLTVSSTTNADNTFKSDYGKSATGTFGTITTEGVAADTGFLPREYNSSTGNVQGVTFRGEAYSTSYQYYRVYVWIDEGYTTTIIGDEITDPLQNATIKVTWSENSMLQQVSGESVVVGENDLVSPNPDIPGLYDLKANLIYTWEELLANGDVEMGGEESWCTNSEICQFNSSLTGQLVIPNSVTGIADISFSSSKLTKVIMPNSITWIGVQAFFDSSLSGQLILPDSIMLLYEGAFENTNITSVIIPNSMNTMLANAFGTETLTDVYYKGTKEEWQEIEMGEDALHDNVTIHYNYTD